MRAVRSAWRLKETALRLSVVPLGLIVLLLLIEPALHALAGLLAGPVGELTGDPAWLWVAVVILIQGIQLALEAVFLAMLLQAVLAPPADGRPPLGPGRRPLAFGLAMLPAGLVLAGLQFWLGRVATEAAVSLVAEDPAWFDSPWLRLGLDLLASPLLRWLPAGLLAVPLARRLLALGPAADAAIGGGALVRLLGFLGVAFVAAEVLARGAMGMVDSIPGLAGTPTGVTLAVAARLYVGGLVLLTLLAARLALLLRRAAPPAAARFTGI